MNEIKPEIRESVLSYLCAAANELGFQGLLVINDRHFGAYPLDLSRDRDRVLREMVEGIKHRFDDNQDLDGDDLEECYQHMTD